MTGHGGDEFLKFQDVSEVTTDDLRSALAAARRARSFGTGMVMVDTCQVRGLRAVHAPGTWCPAVLHRRAARARPTAAD